MAAKVPTPISITHSAPEIRVSTASIWPDRIWQFDVTIPGMVRSDMALDWGFVLPDGSRFTGAQWAPWCEAAKRFLWALRVDPLPGRRRARDSSLMRMHQHLRVLIRWMVGEGYCCFADLDRDTAERFLAAVKTRPGRKGRPLSGATLAGYASILNTLYLQRDRLTDSPSEDLLGTDRLRLLGTWKQRRGSLPCTPDAVAVPLVSAAIRLLGGFADDVIALRDRVEAIIGDATIPLDQRAADARIRAVIASFSFSKLADEGIPRRTEPVTDLAGMRFLVSRLYDACFVVIAYLVGARISEILGLKVGCIVEHLSADGAETFAYLRGRIYKTADGPGGQPHSWVAPTPVMRAIVVLERLSEPVRRCLQRDELWLTAARTSYGEVGVHIHRSGNLIARLNGPFATFIDLPVHNGRPWHLTPHQGRKTFARFVGRRDRTGLHALAAHFGHLNRVMTDTSYVGTDFELADMIGTEALEETRNALEELLTATRLAGKAGRTINAGSRFRGRIRDGDVSEYVEFILRETDMRLGVCDWGYCVYRRESSACLGGEQGPNPALRTQSICATCANFAVTEKHRPVWAERRQRNADLLLHPALDPESRALAAARVEECDRLLAELDQSRGDDGG